MLSAVRMYVLGEVHRKDLKKMIHALYVAYIFLQFYIFLDKCTQRSVWVPFELQNDSPGSSSHAKEGGGKA